MPAFALVALIDTAERAFAWSGVGYKLLLMPGYERTRWKLGIWRAWRSFYLAYRRVPAYRDYIDKRGGLPELHLTPGLFPDLSAIPEMDKASYVKAYPIHQRMKGGKLPRRGVMVDESSGSSGTPTSWVRGPVERQIVSQMMRLSYRESVDRHRPVFILNAFALGAWATGMNVSLSLTPSSIVKSTGPNLDKIVGTMLEFGPGYRYVVMGYPPFLKGLADDRRIDWDKYVVDAGYGGEGISEGLRTYLGKRFKRVVGSYGASDLEVNMAIETELCIALRRAISDDPELRAALIRTDYGVTPMIFQYNPMAYYVETNAAGELVVTMSRPYHIAPKVRYNIHDRGHVLRFPQLKRILRETRPYRSSHRGRARDRPAFAVPLRPVGHVDRLLRRQRHAREHSRGGLRGRGAGAGRQHLPAPELRGCAGEQADGDRGRAVRGRANARQCGRARR